jgi:hypothetical protein
MLRRIAKRIHQLDGARFLSSQREGRMNVEYPQAHSFLPLNAETPPLYRSCRLLSGLLCPNRPAAANLPLGHLGEERAVLDPMR